MVNRRLGLYNTIGSRIETELTAARDIGDTQHRDTVYFWLDVANQAKNCGNFHVSTAIISTLNACLNSGRGATGERATGNVRTLKPTLPLDPAHQTLFEQLMTLHSENHAFENMRKEMTQRQGNSQPVLPYIGLLGNQLIILAETTTSDGSLLPNQMEKFQNLYQTFFSYPQQFSSLAERATTIDIGTLRVPSKS